MDSRHLGLPPLVTEPRRPPRRTSVDASIRLQDAYHHCLALARSHYLPIASRMLPRRLRGPVAVIHAFARSVNARRRGAVQYQRALMRPAATRPS
jgi:hypothetical protein